MFDSITNYGIVNIILFCYCIHHKTRYTLGFGTNLVVDIRMRKKDRQNTEAIKKAIEIFGSMEKLSAAIGGNQASVYKWVHDKAVPTPLSCMKIEKATKGQVTKEEIRPDFDWKNFKLL